MTPLMTKKNFFDKFFIYILFLSSIETIEFCGKSNEKHVSLRVIGGTDADIINYPFMASLQFDKRHLCGATIIDKSWLLTAAHCIEPNGNLENYTLLIGTTDLRHPKSTVEIETVIRNGCFDNQPLFFTGDIALIKTKIDMIDRPDTGLKIGTICLPKLYAEPVTRNQTIIGWGVSKQNSVNVTDILQMVETQLHSEQYCLYMLEFSNMGFIRLSPTNKKLCVHSLDNSGCKGDSGGPLFEMIDGKPVQNGITSHGTSNFFTMMLGFHCYQSEGVLYTKVSSYIDWILNVIENDKKSAKNGIITTKC